jgi:hypothetical protein
MDFDEVDNLAAVLFAMEHLYLRGKPQTARAIYKAVWGMVSEPTIVKYRLWLFDHSIIEPPRGFENPERWKGRQLLFKVYRERMPKEFENVYATNHVLRKRFDVIHDKGLGAYVSGGGIRLSGEGILKRVRETVGEDEFLSEMMNMVRPQLPRKHRNAQLDRDTFNRAVETGIFDTNFEKHRYPFKGSVPRESHTFMTSIARLLRGILKAITNFRPRW